MKLVRFRLIHLRHSILLQFQLVYEFMPVFIVRLSDYTLSLATSYIRLTFIQVKFLDNVRALNNERKYISIHFISFLTTQ